LVAAVRIWCRNWLSLRRSGQKGISLNEIMFNLLISLGKERIFNFRHEQIQTRINILNVSLIGKQDLQFNAILFYKAHVT